MLSIIIPTLNEEKYLPLLLDSIKAQRLNNPMGTVLEVIVADAGSKDRTQKIAKNYGCKIVSGGLPPKGKNEGAKVAKGELFLFLDADVVLPENFLERILKNFEERKLDISAFLITPRTKSKGSKFLFDFFYNWPTSLFGKILPHATQAIFVKKFIHQKLGGFDEEIKIGEDHIYAREGAKIGKFGLLKSPKIFSSQRRFEKDGWLKTYLKYILCEIYMVFLGPVKSDIFKYRFDHY